MEAHVYHESASRYIGHLAATLEVPETYRQWLSGEAMVRAAFHIATGTASFDKIVESATEDVQDEMRRDGAGVSNMLAAVNALEENRELIDKKMAPKILAALPAARTAAAPLPTSLAKLSDKELFREFLRLN